MAFSGPCIKPVKIVSLTATAPIGIAPLVMLFAIVMMSGRT